MATQNTTQQTSNSQGAGDDKGEKLLAGKYKTQEELENGYKELERKFHEGRQKEGELVDRLDRIEQRLAQPVERQENYGRGQSNTEYANQPDPNDTHVLTEFYNSPRKVLETVEERAAARAEQRILQRQQASSKAAERVQAWANENSDITPYGDLLGYYVAQTPQEWSVERRLDEGAKRARERLVAIRGTNSAEEKPNPNEFIDGAGGSGGGANRQQSRRAAPAEPDREAELVKHISAHNQNARKPLGGK